MLCLAPQQLSDLFTVFDRLEHGELVLLGQVGPRGRSGHQCAKTEGESGAGPKVHGLTGPCLGLLSSGSTGNSRVVWWRWADLLAEVKRADMYRGWTWASPFWPWTYAGVQVAIHAWANCGRVISLDAAVRTGAGITWPGKTDGMNSLSCTPTFIDLLLQNESGAQATGLGWSAEGRLSAQSADVASEPTTAQAHGERLQQITLGGEVLRAALGHRLCQRFPSTRFTVVYATTEFGVLLKTHRLDGWYEVASLERRHAEWRVSQGILEIKKDRVWYSTGDLVERQGELMRVIGRAGEVANVAGTKVNLAEVSGAAEEVAGVRRAMAMAESNTITGQIVCLKYVVERGYKPEEVQRRLEEHLRLRLRKEAWPRRYEEGETGLGNNAKRVQSRSMHSGGY